MEAKIFLAIINEKVGAWHSSRWQIYIWIKIGCGFRLKLNIILKHRVPPRAGLLRRRSIANASSNY